MNAEAGGLSAALVAALGELSDVPKSGLVRMSGRPDRTYPTLADVHATARPVLAAHGLCALQDVSSDGDWVRVVTWLVHVSGERWSFGPISRPAGRDVQMMGSEVTYCRRYGLLAALGLAGEDDDGQGGKDRGSTVSSHPLTPSTPSKSVGTPRGSGVPTGSAQLRAARAAVARAEEWRARVRALPAGDVRSAAAKVFTDGGAVPGTELSPEQAVTILGKLKRHEPRIVLAEKTVLEEEAPELFDDGPHMDDEDMPVDD